MDGNWQILGALLGGAILLALCGWLVFRKRAGNAAPPRLAAPAPTGMDRARPLSEAERLAMLDGVRNLARSQPEQAAQMIRNWMESDRAN
ncbi:MAG: hypothetical protein K1X75_08390 [Leptospirales bacterium]|nr:hypothetical protein [Leptospirales bacterium]